MALDRVKIVGGTQLKGEIQISGSKNAALPLLAATVLTSEKCRLRNLPRLKDVETMTDILKVIGTDVEGEGTERTLQTKKIGAAEAPYDFVRKMRASVLLLGPLLARDGSARVSIPGGCAIGVRPIDLHIQALEALGAKAEIRDGFVEAEAKKLRGAHHTFATVTVTGTINAMMAAAAAEGESQFVNCACEPEVVAVAEALSVMGAEVRGAGTHTIQVTGRDRLKGFDLSVIPDRIETGTYLVAAALTRGDLFLRGARADHLQAVVAKLKETGAEVKETPEGIIVVGPSRISPTRLETMPYPGFPTDMQAQFVALLCLAKGTSSITETIFENRFMHISELARMGADLRVKGSMVSIRGVASLTGAPVMATDLRASASLVLAGLAAKGTTEVLRIYHLDRGYENMEGKLRKVGANIVRVGEERGRTKTDAV